MNTFDEFREFVKDKPFLKELVKNKEYTWQELYERYDLYGSDDEVFSEHKEDEEVNIEEENNEESSDAEGFSSILGLLSGLDMDKISDSLSSMKKVLNILAEVTKKDDGEDVSNRKRARPYMKEDD